jgi:lysophospholipase L1-like esterase
MSQPRAPAERREGKPAESPARVLYARRLMPAGRVLVVILVTLLAWTLLYAPTLKRAAEASPLGARRTVSLAVLRPVAAVSDWIGLNELAGSIERAIGRDQGRPGGAFVPPPEDIPLTPEGDEDPSSGNGGNGGQNGEGDGDGATAEADSIRAPTPDRKLRVAIVGDSLAAGLGYFAERVFLPRLVKVSRQGRISTGLARPDYFNWPYTMQRIVDRFDPDLVIVMLGENDHQSLQTVHGEREALIGTSEWPPTYRERVLTMMRIATSQGAKVVWAGLPISADFRVRDHSRRQNEIFAFAASISNNVAYFDAWERFREPEDGYTAYFREGRRVILIREGDGLHFNAIGYTILAREIAKLAVEEFGLSPRTFQTAI